MKKLLKSTALVISLVALAACGGGDDDESSSESGMCVMKAMVGGESYSVVDGASCHSVGSSTYENGALIKRGAALRSISGSKALTVWFGLDANQKVVPGTYEVVASKSALGPGKGCVEYHPSGADPKIPTEGQFAASGTLVLESVYEDPTMGFRGGKGTFTGIIQGSAATIEIKDGTFEAKLSAYQ